MTKSLTAGLIQHENLASRQETLDRTCALARQAAGAGAQLIVLQELHAGPYFCQCADVRNFELAEPIPGATSGRLAALARELDAVLVGSIFEARAPGIYHNTAVVFERDGSIAGKYRKMHIPDDPGFYEKFYFTPGDLGFEPIQTSIGKLGVLVCWDQWFPEAARLMALKGAELLIYPTAIGWDPRDDEAEKQRQRDAWFISQRAHAVANGLPVLAVNRIGFETDPSGALPGIQFWGSSFVAGPQGEILAQADAACATALTAEIDLGRGQDVRRIWPFFRDRRIDAYHGLSSRFLE